MMCHFDMLKCVKAVSKISTKHMCQLYAHNIMWCFDTVMVMVLTHYTQIEFHVLQ